MNKEFIPYEEALALKELGFDEPCFSLYLDNDKKTMTSSMKGSDTNSWLKAHYSGYGDSIATPLYQQAFRWFRKKHRISSFIRYTYYDGMHYGFSWVKSNGDYGEDWKDNDDDCKGWDTYEEAELACLKKLIELVK